MNIACAARRTARIRGAVAAAVIVALAIIVAMPPTPADAGATYVVVHGSRSQPVIALTFDDGRSVANTQRIFNILQRRKVKATFFPDARAVLGAPSLWRSIAAAGHPIANHTYDDVLLTRLSPSRIRWELTEARRTIERITGRPMVRVYRPPGGAYTATVRREAAAAGFATTVLWDVSSADDAQHASRSSIQRRALAGSNGSIVLLHAGPAATPAILDAVITGYRERGFRFVTIPELLGSTMAPWPRISPAPTPTPVIASPLPPTETIPPAGPGPSVGGCPLFPADNFWNTPVDGLPVHPQSRSWIDAIGRDAGFHMDFGSGTWAGGPIGIPYNVVDSSTPAYPFTFYYPGESDPGPYPIPADFRREWGSDHHVLLVERDSCTLYEIYDASVADGQWNGGSGAIWDLRSNALRPANWTSGDLAGTAILPGLARYDEIASGEIRHALRFTAFNTAEGHVWPARHPVPNLTDEQDSLGAPPMGARFRLKAGFDISRYPPDMRVILRAMQQYGIVLTDNGSAWYVSGSPDERWDNDMLHLLDDITGDDFEAVDTSVLMMDADSARARQP